VIALIFGVGAGVLHFTGITVIIAFVVSFFLLSYIYYSKVLQINEEDFGQNELLMEGVGNGIGLFMVSNC
jgi:hypothetical protein